MNSKHTSEEKKVTVDKLAEGYLPANIVEDFHAVEIDVWVRSKPGLHVHIGKDEAEFNLSFRIATPKIVRLLSLTGLSLMGLLRILEWLAPILEKYYSSLAP